MKTRRSYTLLAELIDPEPLRKAAGRRRQALATAGCSTYVIGMRGGRSGIVCLCCGLGSSNVNDLKERYCGFCHEWHVDAKEEGGE